MAIAVTPGGAYFWLHSGFGDVMRGEIINYGSALATAAAAGTRDVADLSIPGDFGAPTVLSGHPKVLTFTGTGSKIALGTSYDNGIDLDGTPPFVESEFLVELQGAAADAFVAGSVGLPYAISQYVSADNGQSIDLQSSVGGLLTGVSGMKVWRVAGLTPGDDPVPAFWTEFIGTREIP